LPRRLCLLPLLLFVLFYFSFRALALLSFSLLLFFFRLFCSGAPSHAARSTPSILVPLERAACVAGTRTAAASQRLATGDPQATGWGCRKGSPGSDTHKRGQRATHTKRAFKLIHVSLTSVTSLTSLLPSRGVPIPRGPTGLRQAPAPAAGQTDSASEWQGRRRGTRTIPTDRIRQTRQTQRRKEERACRFP